MADIVTEIENTQRKMGRPIPGQSLTEDPDNSLELICEECACELEDDEDDE